MCIRDSNVVNLKIPPLSERTEDIPLLANHLLRQSADRHKPSVRAFSSDAMKRLMAAKWPGNVRQLVNVIEPVSYTHLFIIRSCCNRH